MPPINNPLLASAGIIVATVAVAAAYALYESPEVRRVADDLRRRIAIAIHALGDNVDPARQSNPRFNRPEDAEGFLHSRGGANAEPGVDADDETRRRQREELMYWNSLREEKTERERRESQQALISQPSPARSLTFDDFLKEDKTAERGTFVYNTGASPWGESQPGLVRRRGTEGVRGLNASMIANPFGDENGIELDDQLIVPVEHHALSPGKDEVLSNIYDATPLDGRSSASHTLSPQSKPVVPEVLFDFDSHTRSEPATADSVTVDHSQTPVASRGECVIDRELADDEFMTAGQSDSDAYASIQAWAQTSNPEFYSPLPGSPEAPLSEPEMISEGALTPTYSASIAESGVDLGNYAASSKSGGYDAASSKGGDYDAMSEDGEVIPTPNSWSEVGSEISESDAY